MEEMSPEETKKILRCLFEFERKLEQNKKSNLLRRFCLAE